MSIKDIIGRTVASVEEAKDLRVPSLSITFTDGSKLTVDMTGGFHLECTCRLAVEITDAPEAKRWPSKTYPGYSVSTDKYGYAILVKDS